ncbi:MAG TPA: glycosyltransferase [Chthoniobacteraceae bacterium]|nr:glycosyltransferase [Chthoniobacteraceae bacterium]
MMPVSTSSAPTTTTPLERISVRAKFFFEGDTKFFLKGVTYGPFSPNADGDYLASPEKTARDFSLMRELGVNVIRIYHVPPRWLLDLCREYGLRAIISIPWAEHVEFLNNRKVRKEILRTIRDAVARNKGHDAIFAYLVGNEIPTTMVRWLGTRRVIDFVERLVHIARETDPGPLYSYASYPPTEYLLPQNVDFYTFNVYLERRDDFERYLARLQNLTDEKPLIMGEFGLDTMRKGEEAQAEVLDWHFDCVVRGGTAGTIFFSWTDEWFTGGQEILDWEFGLVRRDRTPKKAFHLLKKKLSGNEPVTSKVRLDHYPSVSIIVCSYNGAKTLKDCLESLDLLNYPNYQIVLVDDGSRDNTQQLVADFEKARNARLAATGCKLPDFLNIVQPNMGLSYARNAGARASSGEIITYTDSDCMPDPDWLYFMVGTLLSGDYCGVGGPNISPPAVNWVQAAVAAAPGGPSHVLLSDVVAEHIPGCNMMFHRWAFEGIGGFDVDYRKAGDDVDFCWRLQNNGGVIAFSPAAIVWHYRRFTLQAFRKQQEGYGEAESQLRFKHLIFFGPTGTAKWKGQIYGAPRFTWLLNRPVIYHGVFGQGLFQSIYPTPQSEIAAYVSCIEWVALTVVIFIVSIAFPVLRIVPYLMFGATFLVALSFMIHARIEPRYDTVFARLLVAFLAFRQPLVRGWARYFTWLKFKQTPKAVIARQEERLPGGRTSGSISKLNFWSEEGAGREKLLEEIFAQMEEEDWRYSADTGWKGWDIQIYGNRFWSINLKSVTEYHGGPKCLTRVRLSYTPVVTTLLLALPAPLVLLYPFQKPGIGSFLLLGVYLLFLLVLFFRGYRLKRRVAALVTVAAHRAGLHRMHRKQGLADAPVPESKESEPAAE